MVEVKKENESVQVVHKKINLTNKFRENPWVLSTVICGVLAVVLLVSSLAGGLFNGNVSANTAGKNLLAFYQSLGVSGLAIDSVSEVSGMYEVNFEYQNSIVPIYVTKDGKLFTESVSSLDLSSSSTSTTTTEVPKSDKPTVELYVYSYCPYGLQMEKAIIPVVELFGDKIDFKIRQIGAMHGDYEKVEAQRQLCVEKNYPDKFLDYLLAFAEDTSCSTGADTCLTAKLTSLYTELGINANTINSCMTSDGVTMYNAEVSNANSEGVSGSPTLIINGVDVSVNRNPEAIKGEICNAFNDVPSECSTTLSTASASAGFGSSTSSSSSSASC